MSRRQDNPSARGASPAWIVNAALGVALGLSIILIGAAQRLPSLPFPLEIEGQRVVASGSEVTEIRSSEPGAVPFALKPIDVIDEPDVVGSWAELDDFYARQGALWERLRGPSAELRIDGTWRTVAVQRRSLGQLPFAFYVLLLASLVAWVVGFVTYAFSDRALAARIYVVSAVAFCFAVWPAALYSTRPLAIEPAVFRLLSTVDHAGALLFAAGVIGLLAVYPVRLVRPIWWLWATAVVAAAAGHFQWGDMAISGFYTPNAVQFVLFLGFALWQWRASRADPLHRAALGWILLSMFTGVIFFFSLITLPVLLGARPTISQTTGLVSIVLMYVGISLGVLRFRLFELDRWWFRTWSWILSGAVVVGADLLLTRLFAVEHNVALIVALVVVGWVYFPIRQWLFERFGKVGTGSRAYDSRKLITAATAQELRASFKEALESSFAPLEIIEDEQPLGAPRLAGEGAWLEVPSPTNGGTFRCHFREKGARLFSREDVSRAIDLLTLSESVRVAIDARQDGETAERTRIRRDLHDDLGASIIRIAHEATDERTARLAKAAMRDLRDVLTALDDRPSTYRDALDELEADLRARAQADGRTFEWIVRGETDRVLDARNRANLTRALRESMTNALKHGSGTISYVFDVGSTELSAIVTNEASDDEPVEVGMGIDNITSRLAELGGAATYSRRGGLFTLTLTLPWNREP